MLNQSNVERDQLNLHHISLSSILEEDNDAGGVKITNVGEGIQIGDVITFGQVASLGTGTASDTELLYNNSGAVDGDPDLTYNGEVLTIGTATSLVGATRGLSIGTGHTITHDRCLVVGLNNTASGRDCLVQGEGNTASSSRSQCGGQNSIASGIESFCWGDGSTAGPGAHSYVLGDESTATASGSMTIGHKANNSAIECITLSANDSSDTAPSLAQTNESIVLYARNLDSYDDGVRIICGDDLALQECSVKDHNSTLSWSFSPTTPGDWSPSPDNVGDALDQLASGAGTPTLSSVLTSGNDAGGNDITNLDTLELAERGTDPGSSSGKAVIWLWSAAVPSIPMITLENNVDYKMVYETQAPIISPTWSCSAWGATPQNASIEAFMQGNTVTITIGGLSAAGGGSATDFIRSTGSYIPTDMRPSSNLYFPIQVETNASSALGILIVTTTGSIHIYDNIDSTFSAGYFPTSANLGMSATSLSYTV